MSDYISLPKELATRLIETFWFDQWETRNAAENTVCSYGCGEQYEDFDAHTPTCEFVKEWQALSSICKELGIEHHVTIREKT